MLLPPVTARASSLGAGRHSSLTAVFTRSSSLRSCADAGSLYWTDSFWCPKGYSPVPRTQPVHLQEMVKVWRLNEVLDCGLSWLVAPNGQLLVSKKGTHRCRLPEPSTCKVHQGMGNDRGEKALYRTDSFWCPKRYSLERFARPVHLSKYIKDCEMIEAVRARPRSSGWCPFRALALYMKRTNLVSKRVLAGGAPGPSTCRRNQGLGDDRDG
jgi:hypothetical protein